MIEVHEQSRPHHQPPCQYFTEHRATFFWVIGGLTTAALIFASFLMTGTNENAAKNRELELSIARMGMDMAYIKEAVADIRQSLKSDKK